jgi:dephospho-CoA kinase
VKPRPRVGDEGALTAGLSGSPGSADRVRLSLRPAVRSVVVIPIRLLLVLAVVALGLWMLPIRPGGSWEEIRHTSIVVVLVVMVAQLVWEGFARAARLYIVTDRSVVVREGVLGRTVSRLPIDRIQQVTLVQPLAERLSCVGSILIETAGSGSGYVVLRAIHSPERVVRVLERVSGRASGWAGKDGVNRPRSGGTLMSVTTSTLANLPPRGIVVLGLAGGIGAGKSAVAAEFARQGCVVVDSDHEAKAALDRPEVREALRSWWGDGVLNAAGQIDRKAVANIVFTRPEERARLEALVHPLIRQRRSELVARAAESGAAAVIVDAPLLFEAGVDAECDAVIFVDAPREVRLERVMRTRGWDDAELARRESAQWSVERKREASRFVVANDGPREALVEPVREILRQVGREVGRP